METIEWKCPQCGMTPDGCSDAQFSETVREKCIERPGRCLGFICECDSATEITHGETYNDRCTTANCYHCGWGGTFPKLPRKVPAWAKTALKEGWTPPKGWTP